MKYSGFIKGNLDKAAAAGGGEVEISYGDTTFWGFKAFLPICQFE